MLKFAVVGRFVYEVASYNPKTGEMSGRLSYDVWDDYYLGGLDDFIYNDVDKFFAEREDARNFCYNQTHFSEEE